MRLLSTLSLLAIMAFAGACSKSNYAQVEPDDLYPASRNLQAAQAYSNVSASASTDVSSYANQHSPSLYTTELGSPTIQLHEQQFYDASQNPDYLSGQAVASSDGLSDMYYADDYESYNSVTTAIVASPALPQTTINYYGSGYSPYYSNFYRRGYPYYRSRYYSPFSYTISYGYGPNGWYPIYGYNEAYLGDYAGYFGYSYYGSSYGYCPPSYYSGYTNNYSGNDSNYNSNNITSYYGTNDVDRSSKTLDGDNTQLNGPRVSTSSVSYYANKNNYDVKRRDNYTSTSAVEEGRITTDDTRGRYAGDDAAATMTNGRKRASQESAVNRRPSVSQSSGTVQRNNTNARKSYSNNSRRTVNGTRDKESINRNSTTQRSPKTYVNRSSNGRSSNVNRSAYRQSANNSSSRTTRTRYSSSSNSRSNSSYQSQRSNSNSKRSYSKPASSGNRSSSYSTPSRSTKTKSSYSAPRSSSTRSSGTRSSGSSSKSSSGRKKN